MNDTIRKLVIPVAAIAAMGYGGAQLAGASGQHSSSAQSAAAASSTPAGDGDGETADDAQTNGDPADPAEQVTGGAAAKAKAAALKAVPGGTVGEIHRESKDDAGQQADTPEPGDTPDEGGKADTPEPGDTPDKGSAADRPEAGDAPDPSYESKIAYDVDVTKADGSTVTVHLDQAFAVLGTTADEPDHGSDD